MLLLRAITSFQPSSFLPFSLPVSFHGLQVVLHVKLLEQLVSLRSIDPVVNSSVHSSLKRPLKKWRKRFFANNITASIICRPAWYCTQAHLKCPPNPTRPIPIPGTPISPAFSQRSQHVGRFPPAPPRVSPGRLLATSSRYCSMEVSTLYPAQLRVPLGCRPRSWDWKRTETQLNQSDREEGRGQPIRT